jgi:hypothetical protein
VTQLGALENGIRQIKYDAYLEEIGFYDSI